MNGEGQQEWQQGEGEQQGETGEGEVSMEQQEMGKTSIADAVVAKVAEIATREIRGVHELGGATERVVSGAISKITGGAGRAAGVNVEVGEEEAAIDINMIAEYGMSIPEVANNVRQNVVNQVQAFTGLRVKEVNIAVNDLYFPGEEAQEQGEREEGAS
jgi:uncharacterized alkaline shock family protein YloU